MERLLNLMLDILDSRDIKGDYDLACYIWDLTHEGSYEDDDDYNGNINLLKETFESLDVDIVDKEDYINYLTENMNAIISEIEEFTHFRLTDMHESGCKFNRETEDDNKYYSDEEDFFGDEWIDIDELEEELDSEQQAGWLCGNMPSRKKDRTNVIYRDGELDW